MRSEDILDAIGEVSPADVADAAQPVKKRFPVWAKALSAAACLCLVLTGTFALLFGGMGAGAGGISGGFADGYYYFSVRNDGIYRHSLAEGSEKVLGSWRYRQWEVNDYGLYYSNRRALYVVEHETGHKRLLYRSGLFDSSHVGFTLRSDGSIIVTVYNKWDEYSYELLLDGVTGEVLDTVMEKTPYGNYGQRYSDTHFLVGEREIVLEPAADRDYGFTVTEKGENLLPEEYVSNYPDYRDGELWISVSTSHGDESYFIVRPDGGDLLITLPDLVTYVNTYDNGIVYHTDTEPSLDGDLWQLWCYDTSTEESWEMPVNDPLVSLYEMSTDGELLYSSAPWLRDEVALWRIVYADGRPAALELLDENILD